jgi:indolepyruvate ferredoxin oxidoreductase
METDGRASMTKARSLEDRYQLTSGSVMLTGVQALVRLPLEQARRDRKAGLRCGTFITGFPGSPLGGYDLALKQAGALLLPLGIVHQPAGNEEGAATALMGTQLLERYPNSRFDGVVGFWYGKGPGLDRAGDAIRHGNYAGTTTHGAVVVLSGEDHEAKSSTMPYGQEYYFVHAGMPVLHPSSVAEFLELGLHAVALSRYSGLWVAMKLVGQLCDGGQTVHLDPALPRIALPELSISGRPFQKRQYHRFFPGETVETERLLYAERLPAAIAYARHSHLDRLEVAGPRDRLALLSAGKSFADLRAALLDLGLDDRALSECGIRLVKLGMIYPLDTRFAAEALRGLLQVVVIEEKRGFVEERIKEALYPFADRPEVIGKKDELGAPLFPDFGGMDADLIAELIGPRLLPLAGERRAAIQGRLAELRAIRERGSPQLLRRTPNYCSGCPHSVSLKVLQGEVAWSAPGCHVFATLIEQPERHADATFQLGGEGLAWLGLSPFTDRTHIIQNQGDGALFHSSYLNIRQAVAAKVNLTFRILYNGVVANTGAEALVGQRDVPTLARLLALEGVSRIAIVAREPSDYRGLRLPEIVSVHARDRIDTLLRELEVTPGVTILLYDGECANERRRKQKRGLREKPSRFVLIDPDVCENCGHCGALTNCMSLHKVETEYGEKTQVHQSSCNQDQFCLEGDCPSFLSVDVRGGGVRRPKPGPIELDGLPEPHLPSLHRPYQITIPGVGGTGVLTLNSVLAWAALLDGREVLSYDQTGAAQKWGAVLSSVVVGEAGHPPLANKVGLGAADLYLALDLMAGADRQNLARCQPSRTAAVVNTTLLPSGEMVRDVHLDPRASDMEAAIGAVCDSARTLRVPARRLAEALFGDAMATNFLALGVASQAGLLPVTPASIEAALELNGTAVAQSVAAFRAGRWFHHRPAQLEAAQQAPPATAAEVAAREGAELGGQRDVYQQLLARAAGLPEEGRRLLAHRLAELIRFQDAACAGRYLDAVLRPRGARGRPSGRPPSEITLALIRNLYKLTAYKDEYEVARLHLRSSRGRVSEQAFTGEVRVHYNLHPPFLRALGMHRKLRLGRWFDPVLVLLARLKRLRGTPLDPFGYARLRREERRPPGWYLGLVQRGLAVLRPDNRQVVAALASLPDRIRGYEELKLFNIAEAGRRSEELLRELERKPLQVLASA